LTLHDEDQTVALCNQGVDDEPPCFGAQRWNSASRLMFQSGTPPERGGRRENISENNSSGSAL